MPVKILARDHSAVAVLGERIGRVPLKKRLLVIAYNRTMSRNNGRNPLHSLTKERKMRIATVGVYVLSLLAWPLVFGGSVFHLAAYRDSEPGLLIAIYLLVLTYPLYGLVGLIAAWRSGHAAWLWLLTPSLLFAIVGVGFVVFLGIHMIQH
jgi:hypothetical protein